MEQSRPQRRSRRGLAVLTAGLVALIGFTVGTAAVAAPGDAGSWAVARASTAKVADLVGAGSINDTGARYGVEGTDLGHMFMVGPQMAMTFGDTFGAPPAKDFFSVAHTDWRSNVIASIDPPASPAKGLPFRGMITDRAGHAKELIPSQKRKGIQETVIPTYGIATGAKNTTMNLQYMSVKSFDTPGHWRLTGSGIVTSTDGGTTWTDSGARWAADSKFGQVAYVRPGGPDDPKAPVAPGTTPGSEIYVYGIPGGRYGDLSLAKVPADRLTDTAAYRYWNGTAWVAGEANAAPVVKGPVGELSVRWNSFYKQWIMMYLVDDTGEVVLRTAPAPTGPWTPAQVVTTTKDFPQAYAPYVTPRWNDGPDIWFTMSQFTTYRVELMTTRLAPLAAGAALPAAVVPQSVPARQGSLSAPPVPTAAPAAAPAATTPATSAPASATPTTAPTTAATTAPVSPGAATTTAPPSIDTATPAAVPTTPAVGGRPGAGG
ncbi:DUF4185 domain-containing protein [Actinomycetospora termitidis]|uniref:DUF4185 domain-containing protein n=1 Tax=Actinomycetospora termitidis TaxID=3053470 RepID=A0ABT7MD45_9PSEU|nr:DUF4185 domain-containing protein [Actinomycetospora sp. Odt1-22]MDL5158568.1 DUF4185 domain-containing protein [Actinomycetospora sp. Odt1-22]